MHNPLYPLLCSLECLPAFIRMRVGNVPVHCALNIE